MIKSHLASITLRREGDERVANFSNLIADLRPAAHYQGSRCEFKIQSSVQPARHHKGRRKRAGGSEGGRKRMLSGKKRENAANDACRAHLAARLQTLIGIEERW